jgi:hypothetical protein
MMIFTCRNVMDFKIRQPVLHRTSGKTLIGGFHCSPHVKRARTLHHPRRAYCSHTLSPQNCRLVLLQRGGATITFDSLLDHDRTETAAINPKLEQKPTLPQFDVFKRVQVSERFILSHLPEVARALHRLIGWG